MKKQLALGVIPHLVFLNYKRPLYDSMIRIHSSNDCLAIIQSLGGNDRLDYKEFFWVILINNANCVLGISKISEGSDSGTVASSKEIVQLALLSHATAVVLVHNHPSGNVNPSSEDLGLTKALQKIFVLFQIKLLDHFIITSESHYSFADEGII